MQKVFLSRLHYPVTALGPGSRIGIWFQGCSLHCPGCISADTWAKRRGETTIDAVMQQMAPWLCEATGVTISGGEPFEQLEALNTLLLRIRADFDGDILVYSGYDADEISLLDHNNTRSLIDVIIAGRYKRDEEQSLLLRGSNNQKVLFFTDKGRERFQDYFQTNEDRKPALDVMFDPDGCVWFAGIPQKGDFQRLQRMLRQAGHQVRDTQDRTT